MTEAEPTTDIEAQAEHIGLSDPASTLRLVLGAIAMQAGTQALTKLVDQAVLGVSANGQNQTDETPKKPGKIKTLSSRKLAGIATKSIPGAAVIACGLLAKYVFDRGGQRKQRRRDANQPLSGIKTGE